MVCCACVLVCGLVAGSPMTSVSHRALPPCPNCWSSSSRCVRAPPPPCSTPAAPSSQHPSPACAHTICSGTYMQAFGCIHTHAQTVSRSRSCSPSRFRFLDPVCCSSSACFSWACQAARADPAAGTVPGVGSDEATIGFSGFLSFLGHLAVKVWLCGLPRLAHPPLPSPPPPQSTTRLWLHVLCCIPRRTSRGSCFEAARHSCTVRHVCAHT
jgi:hypothetical protein